MPFLQKGMNSKEIEKRGEKGEVVKGERRGEEEGEGKLKGEGG